MDAQGRVSQTDYHAALDRRDTRIKALEAEANDSRLLGARDGLVSAMLVIRRDLGGHRERLRLTPAHHVHKRAATEEIIAMLKRMDDELDRRRRECADAWRHRRDVEIVSSDRPEPVEKLI